MSRILFSAGLLAAFTSALHTGLGTFEIAGPLLRSPLPQALSLLLYACWHLVSVTLIGSAAALLIAAKQPLRHRSMVQLISWLWLCFGFVFIGVALGHSGVAMLFQLPQWVLLILVGVLGLFGSARSGQSL